MAKKNRSPYWSPPRFVAKTSPGHSTLSASDSLALQRVLQSENQRLVKDPYLLQAIFHNSPKVATAAVLALGRVGDPYAIEALSR
ncbi:MAG: HEAT repeat domain-containing protein, partial [Deltaproteobacteria bacterium]|nr:HEAT repeat domain-containing protein [Deltaproteobacteria bacterium]